MSHYNRITIDDAMKAKIVRLYTDDDLTQKDIAGRLGVPLVTVAQVLKEKGVKTKNVRRFHGSACGGVW